MSETLGSLCDKLTIVKLKEFHTTDAKRLLSLAEQEKQLCGEIDDFLNDVVSGTIPRNRLEFQANKVYPGAIGKIREFTQNIGASFSELAAINCDLWHEQEKVYIFEQIPESQKNAVIKRLGMLNLERNNCIDQINHSFASLVKK